MRLFLRFVCFCCSLLTNGSHLRTLRVGQGFFGARVNQPFGSDGSGSSQAGAARLLPCVDSRGGQKSVLQFQRSWVLLVGPYKNLVSAVRLSLDQVPTLGDALKLMLCGLSKLVQDFLSLRLRCCGLLWNLMARALWTRPSAWKLTSARR